MPAVGADDAHFHCRIPGHGAQPDAFGGWTWLKMPSLTVENVLEAIRTGSCYASGGPKIHDFAIEDGKVRLSCSPAARIYFKSDAPGGGQRLIAEANKTIDSWSIDVDKNHNYYRAVVVDAEGRQAWTNAIFL